MYLRCRYRTPYAAQSPWNTLRVFSADQPVTSVTLYQLRPNTFYEVMVLARNRIGDALFSEPHGVRTKGQLRCARAQLAQKPLSKVCPRLSFGLILLNCFVVVLIILVFYTINIPYTLLSATSFYIADYSIL